MRSGFILSCESTIDLPYSYCEQRDIPVLFYSYQVDGVSYEDDMGRDPEALPQFYGFLDAGKLPSTAQLNEFQYETFFDALLQQGDVLHIAFGSGMTASVQNAMLAAETLREKYPERKLTVIDSLCSSSGYGLLVDGAADLRDEGRSMDEIADWVLEKRQKVHHQFYSTELKFYRRSGRMSGAAAAIGEEGAFVSALGLAVGMAIQNFPEGAAVSLPMKTATGSRGKAFLYGMGSGAVEPVFAVVGYFLAANLTAAQPWFLAFAAGAMIFVVVEDLIPDAHLSEHPHFGTWGAMLGFVVMMALDVALG